MIKLDPNTYMKTMRTMYATLHILGVRLLNDFGVAIGKSFVLVLSIMYVH